MNQRDFEILNFPISSEVQISHPEKVIIYFSNNRSLDLGSLCYLKRQTPKGLGHNVRTKKTIRCRPVDLSSFYPKRTKHVERIIRYLSEQMSIGGKRLETIRDSIGRFIPFMDWADANNHIDAFDNLELARAAINDYIRYLHERLRLGEIVLDSALSQQERVIEIFSGYFNSDDLSHGLPLLRNHLSKRNPTSPPDEKRMSDALNLSEILFENICSFILDFKEYPYSIVVPEHYEYPNNQLWIFPTNSWFKHPSQATRGAYNYTDGKIYTLKEMKNNSPQSIEKCLKKSIKSAQAAISSANKDPRNKSRVLLAQLAMNCFVIMFQAETGMNWSQIVNLNWSGEYEIESSRQLFRVIKWRANSRELYFEISGSFLSKFKTFLKLRNYLHNDKEFSFLFFKVNDARKHPQPPTQLYEHQVATYTIMKRIHPDLTYIKNREWRAAKSDWLIRNTDPSTTALILQNSEKTVLSHYSAGSETTQITEFGKFLEGLSKAVLNKGEDTHSVTTRSVGSCSDYLSPSQIIPLENINSDCNSLEGCLFCEKFRVHADETDTRKLLSCRYCLEKIAGNFQGERFYADTLQPLLTRIDAILKEIRDRDPEMIANISNSVEINGELEFYWAQKFQMLLELEVIS